MPVDASRQELGFGQGRLIKSGIFVVHLRCVGTGLQVVQLDFKEPKPQGTGTWFDSTES